MYTGGTHSGNYEGFVLQLIDNSSSAPTLNWIQWLGGTSIDYVQALAVSQDEIYAAGYANSGTSFESPAYTGGTYSGSYEGFVAEIKDNANSAPTLNWLQWLGGIGNDYLYSVAINGDEIYTGGYSDATSNFESPNYTGDQYSGLNEASVMKIWDDPEPSTVLKSNVNLKSNIYLKQ
jgi:hypothetical protein